MMPRTTERSQRSAVDSPPPPAPARPRRPRSEYPLSPTTAQPPDPAAASAAPSPRAGPNRSPQTRCSAGVGAHAAGAPPNAAVSFHGARVEFRQFCVKVRPSEEETHRTVGEAHARRRRTAAASGRRVVVAAPPLLRRVAVAVGGRRGGGGGGGGGRRARRPGARVKSCSSTHARSVRTSRAAASSSAVGAGPSSEAVPGDDVLQNRAIR